MGAMDTLTLTKELCPPEGIDGGQAIDIIKLWLRDHPETRHLAAAIVRKGRAPGKVPLQLGWVIGGFAGLRRGQKCANATLFLILATAPLLLAFGWGGDLSSSDVETFFRGHKVDGYYAVALKKRSVAGVIYLVTIHGFPTNMSVCEDVMAPYNKDPSLSAIEGEYFCEELR